MASYTTSALKALRALTGASAVREIDTGFASLAADVDGQLARSFAERSGNFPAGGGVLNTNYALRVVGADVTGAASVWDAIRLDKTEMVPAGRGWEWRVRGRVWAGATAPAATAEARLGIIKSGAAADGVIAAAGGAPLLGSVQSGGAFAANEARVLLGPWITAPDTAVDGTEWLAVLAVVVAGLGAGAKLFARAWIEFRYT